MKRPIALLALFLAGSAMAGPTLEEARQMVKTHSNEQLCVYLYTAQPMYRDVLATEIVSRGVDCSGIGEQMEQSRRANQQQQLANTLQMMQMFQPQPMPNLIQPQTHCVTRYAAGQWYTDCR